MKLALPIVVPLITAALSTSACSMPLGEARPQAISAEGQTVADNPKAINRRFPSLDAYLSFLEKRSHLDGAWYREVRPGVYELQTGNLRLPDGPPEKRVFTRQELEEKFGFAP